MTEKIDTDEALSTGGVDALAAAFMAPPLRTKAEEDANRAWLTLVPAADQVQATGAAQAYERALIGTLLNDPRRMDVIGNLIRPQHFSVAQLGHIYGVLCHLESNRVGIDQNSLVERLVREHGAEGRQWFNLMGQCAHEDSATSSPQDKASAVFGAWRNRSTAALCAGGYHRAKGAAASDAEEILSDLSNALVGLERPADAGPEEMGISEAILDAYEDLKDRTARGGAMIGIETGFRTLSRLTSGFYPGLFVIKGGTGKGKTAWALSAALKIAARSCDPTNDEKAAVTIVGLEMASRSIGYRSIANLGDVNGMSMRMANCTDEETDRVVGVVHKHGRSESSLNNYLKLLHRPGMTVDALARYCRRKQREGLPLKVVFIDYIQLLGAPPGMRSREQEVAYITKRLVIYAKQFGICFVCLSQINSDGDARESRGIEHDADVIGHIKEADPDADPADDTHLYRFDLEKNREGPIIIGGYQLLFMKRYQRFVEVAERDPYA